MSQASPTAVAGGSVLAERRSRWPVLLAAAAVVAVVAYLALSGIGSTLVYYQTPGELLARGDAAVGLPVRLGGLVKVGSISGPATDLSFVLTDGTSEVTVHSARAPVSSFREGVGAVVQGRLTASGVFEADQVIVKHDENYVAPSEGALPPQVIDLGS
jgi:cytochrome c-type biogenesis protein CcmE